MLFAAFSRTWCEDTRYHRLRGEKTEKPVSMLLLRVQCAASPSGLGSWKQLLTDQQDRNLPIA